jgi:hypothetical protein
VGFLCRVADERRLLSERIEALVLTAGHDRGRHLDVDLLGGVQVVDTVRRVALQHRFAEELKRLLLGLTQPDLRSDPLVVEELLRYRVSRRRRVAGIVGVRLEILVVRSGVLGRHWRSGISSPPGAVKPH